MIIDAHHHFWTPGVDKYPWMTTKFDRINRPFVQSDFSAVLSENDVTGSVLVQTYSSVEETKDFLKLAAKEPTILGVVGWVDLMDSGVENSLDQLIEIDSGQSLVAIRHQVHDEEDPCWLERSEVLQSLSAIAQRRLTYDLLIRPRELDCAIRVVRKFPELTFVVDHIAKPNIAIGEWGPWSEQLRILSEHQNVYCKLSGMITEASWSDWTPAAILPYSAHVLDCFGVDRCMYGSDWPVCLVAGQYSDTIAVVRDGIRGASTSEIDRVFSGSAIEAYGLRSTNGD